MVASQMRSATHRGKFGKEITILKNNQIEVLKMKESINPNHQMETSSTDKMEKNKEYWRKSTELSITFRQQQRKIMTTSKGSET